jgi:nitroreductase
VQNALLSLHAEGIGSKWATGPVIQTPAFRELVQAQATDRVAALIMVGGSTEFASDRERQGTEVRRHRRRSLRGDLVVDLP